MEELFRRIQRASAVRSHYITNYMKYYSGMAGTRRENNILDVGCGSQPFRKFFAFGNYVSIDIERSVRPKVLADICHLPFRDMSIDTIICTEVLEHVENTSRVLLELNRALRPKGQLILTTPFLFGVHDKADFYRWTEISLIKILQNAKFTIAEIRKDGGVFASIGELLRQSLYQVFGPYDDRQNWLKYGLLACLYLLMVPLTRFFMFLDRLDLRKNFTTGYTVLSVRDMVTRE